VETTSHLFFSCPMAHKVVNLINRWWSLADVELESYEDWVIWFDHIRLPSKNKKMLEGVFYVMWWLLWSFCNKTIFESKVPKKALFFDDVVSLSDTIFSSSPFDSSPSLSGHTQPHDTRAPMRFIAYTLTKIRKNWSCYQCKYWTFIPG
nr:RNA-directed DNA polymerase, eukaryota [Tanacetum cinerariifolium]